MNALSLLETYTLREVWAHLDEILKEGYDINDLIELGPPYETYFVENHKKLLSLGADASNLFYESKSRYKQLVDYPDLLAYDLRTFVKYGLDKKVAKNWLEANVKKENIILCYRSIQFFGIDPMDYIDDYLSNHDLMWVWNQIVYKIGPDLITPEVFISHYSVSDISSAFLYVSSKKSFGFKVFVEEYAEQGADIDLLAEKILSAYGGYPEDEDKLVVLAKVLKLGAKNIDANKIIDSLTYKAYNYKDKQSREFVNGFFIKALSQYADESHLAELKPAN